MDSTVDSRHEPEEKFREEALLLASLPAKLTPHYTEDLIRVGRRNDGGYVVRKRDVLETDVLVGLGLNDDWSFEEGFSSLSLGPVYGYDGSVGAIQFLKRSVKSAAPWEPGSPFHYLSTLRRFRSFFSHPNRHYQEYVGLDRSGYVTMDQIFMRHNEGKLFLKIDIEGSEYRLLESILKNQERLSGLVIEFHDVDMHVDQIVDFVEASSLRVVSTHANNFAGVASPGGMPLVVEISMTSSEVLVGPFSTSLEQPNDSTRPGIEIQYV